MAFDSFSDFLHMGGYALYVWLSYGAGLLVFVGITMTSFNSVKQQRNAVIGFLKRNRQQSPPSSEDQVKD